VSADQAPTDSQWKVAVSGFKLVTRIDPKLGRAWNNLGIALTRLAQFDEAREAYQRAVELNTAFGSAERNLTMMETRLLGTKMLGDAAEQSSLPEQAQFPE
jgi:Flp pilus assembly protein TadD